MSDKFEKGATRIFILASTSCVTDWISANSSDWSRPLTK